MAALPQGSSPNFASHFAEPSIQRMLDELSDHQFEHFVAYVFERAGYVVEDTAGHHGPTLDLKLYAGSIAPENLRAGVQVKHYRPDHLVTAPEIGQLRNGIAQNGSVPGYLVTTSSFVAPALAQAQQTPRIWPIDGKRFLRYINYVRGSRPRQSPSQSSPALNNALFPIPPEALFTADAIVRRPTTQTRVLTLANHKGGVGKTTSALNIAFGLATHDKQVLLVDMDTQHNITHALPHPNANSVKQMYLEDYFTGHRDLKQLVRQTQFPRIWVVPSDRGLTLTDVGLAAGPEAELCFARDLHATSIVPPPMLSDRGFDWIIIDTSPSMGFYTRSALAASHYVIMPLSPGAFADLGPEILRTTVDTMAALSGAPIKILGSVITQWKGDKLDTDLLATAAAQLDGVGIPVLAPYVPLDKANIERAHLETGDGQKKTLFSHKASKAAQAYKQLVEEIL